LAGSDLYEGEQIIAYITNNTTSYTDGHVRILISARGRSTGTIYSSFATEYITGDPATGISGTTASIDVKILLQVAAPANPTLPIHS
jgi:hypothetical protein